MKPYGTSPSRAVAGRSGLAVRLLAMAVVVLLGATACGTRDDATVTDTAEAPEPDGAGGPPPPASKDGDAPSEGTEPAGDPGTHAAAAAGEAAPVDAPVGLTPTGIPVAVLDHTPTGVVVRSPCGNEVEVRAVQPVAPVTVVLDPGHGGPVDMGAHAPDGRHESDLNLTVTRAVQERLTTRGIPSLTTRTGDYATPLAVRAALADASGAALFVSLHHNSPASAPSPIPGTEVFVQSASPESARLGGLLYEEVVRALAPFDIAWTRRADAGVLRVHLPDGTDAYGVIRRPRTPTALVEFGYLDNPAEAALFATDAYVDAAATAVADAVEAYLTSDRPGIGHVSAPRTMIPGRSRAGHGCTDPRLQ